MIPPGTDPSSEPLPRSELEFISELCEVVAGQSELRPILDWLVQKSTGLLAADECSIKLLTGASDVARTLVIGRGAEIEAGSRTWHPAVKASVMGFLLSHPGELASADLQADARFPGLRSVPGTVRAVLAQPLRVDGRVTGMIAVSNARAGREWSRQDVQLLGIVASHSASVIEKARLREEAAIKVRLERERELMDQELRRARELQMRLVPDAPLAMGAWRAEGRLVPAREVGGDLYDYFPIDPDRVALVVADVAGKGVPAALLVSTVASAVRAFADGSRSPRGVLEQLNRATLRSSAAGKFVTFFYAELDHARGRLRYANAGHNHPRLRRADGRIERLETGGVPLGLFDGAPFEEAEIAFGPGDALLLFSDGITEAADSFHQEYGEERLESLWRERGAGPGGAFLDRAYDDVLRFRGDAPQGDDMTMLVVCPTA